MLDDIFMVEGLTPTSDFPKRPQRYDKYPP